MARRRSKGTTSLYKYVAIPPCYIDYYSRHIELKAAVENNIIELSQPLESSRDEDDRSLSEVGKNVLKQIFRCIAVVTDLTAMSEAIETNLPEGETITFSYLVKMADPTQWSDEEDKKIAKDAKISTLNPIS